MSKKRVKKRKKKSSRARRASSRVFAKYTAAEIAMAVLGAAIVIMIAGIIITALLG
jgi:hypothetical protein